MNSLLGVREFVSRLTTIPVIGVDIGSAAIKMVEVAESNGQIVIRRAVVASIENNKPAVLLAKLVKEAGFSADHAAIGLASPEVIARPFQFPSMPKHELEGAVQIEAEQAILNGHLPHEMANDWHAFSCAKNSNGSIRGLLAVVPKSIIAARLQTVRAAGLYPTIVDIEGLALWNAYWALIGKKEAASKTVLLINVGSRITNLVIAKGRDELVLSRDLQLGARSFAEGGDGDWISEVQDSLTYARSKGGLRTIDAVYVTGGGSELLKESSSLNSIVRVPITFWNPLDNVVFTPGESYGHPGGGSVAGSPGVDSSAGPLLAVAIGLGLRQFS